MRKNYVPRRISDLITPDEMAKSFADMGRDELLARVGLKVTPESEVTGSVTPSEHISRTRVTTPPIQSTYNLFLDDLRMPHQAFAYTKDTRFDTLEWIVVRSPKEFSDTIEEKYQLGEFPRLISFDHDLAIEHYSAPMDSEVLANLKETGLDCAKWLCEFCQDNNLPLPEYTVHSMNPVGKENILSYLNQFRQVLDNERTE